MKSDESSKRSLLFNKSLFFAVIFVFTTGFLFILGVTKDEEQSLSSGILYAGVNSSSFVLNQANAVLDNNAEHGSDVVVIEETGIQAAAPAHLVSAQALGSSIGESEANTGSGEMTKYKVQSGDTASSIAERFGISVETVLGANDLASGSSLKVGQDLFILPTSGVLHLVRSSDTVSQIAALYKADMADIEEYNGLSSSDEIFAGDLLIIPGGVKPKVAVSTSIPVGNSYFIYPIPAPHRITQGRHAYNATDFSNGSCGESIYAAAGGTVQRTGYDSVAGNYIRILHPNKVVTFYGHLSRILVSPGARVLQGQTIGYTGHTGYTIPAGPGGCHVHFEVRGAANPF